MRIRSLGPGGQRDGYEQFICQQVAQEPPTADAKFVSLHGAGGDGGVECYWTLPDGTEHGWQAKYWTTHADVDKAQLDESVEAALNQHPNLTKYTIAIPADPTGRTGRRGKSLLEKINDPAGWLDDWKSMATARGMTVDFEFEWATNIVTRLERLDTTGIQRRYWFDADVLTAQWWDDRLQEAIDAARPRYMPQLSVEVPAARSIAALCSDDEWWAVVSDQIAKLRDSTRRVRNAKDEVLAADLNATLDTAAKVTDALAAWHTSRTTTELDDLTQALAKASAMVSEQEAVEVAAMDVNYPDDNWDTHSWRQFQAEYQVSFPAAAIDALRELGEKLTGATELLISPVGRLAAAQVALMTGAGGIGKTYLAIDAVVRRLRQGRPSVMIHGRWFTDREPLTQLRDVLQMPSDLIGEEAIALLDEAARVAGVPTLLIIDALNDTRPRSTWRDNLERLITTVERYPNVRLLLTARYTISLDMPAPEFFGPTPGELHWNGRNGWTDHTGQLVATVRHTINAGQNELLIDAEWLERWLTAEHKSLIWIANTGKDAYRGLGGRASHPGRLTRSQVRSWTPGGNIHTAAAGRHRIAASTP